MSDTPMTDSETPLSFEERWKLNWQVAFEAGYVACERGENLQAAFANIVQAPAHMSGIHDSSISSNATEHIPLMTAAAKEGRAIEVGCKMEQDRARLMEALRSTNAVIRLYEITFSATNFTDRYDDANRCKFTADRNDEILKELA